jgi:predicted DNA repair protein MutK
MAAGSLLALLDDIASVLDDVSVLTKVAAKKTAGVLGDDLALNAQQVTGVSPARELPVVWAVFKGSAVNKLILVPAALAISAVAPWLVTPLLMLGGLYLCYEGVEKLAHRFFHRSTGHDPAEATARVATTDAAGVDAAAADAPEGVPSGQAAHGGATEREKIRGAIRTDFILSAEIVAITLGTVAAQPLLTQLSVMAGIAALMTIGVYGLVAGIVKLDDLGLHLSERPGSGAGPTLLRRTGFGILAAAPWLMKTLSVVGTAAMFLVGGGILTHGIASAHHWIEDAAADAAGLPGVGVLLGALTPMLLNAVAGIVAGIIALAVVTLVGKAIAAWRRPGDAAA